MATNVPRMPPVKKAPEQSTEPARDVPAETAPSTTGVPRMPPVKTTATPTSPVSTTPGNYGPNDLSGALMQRAMSKGTFGLTDWAGAGVNALARATGYDPNAPTLEQIRQQNEQVYQEHPYLATAADVAGYVAGPGKVLGPLARGATGVAGRYGAAALEGAAAGGLSSVGEQVGSDKGIDPYAVGKSVLTGGAAGGVGQAVGDIVGAAARPIADRLTGLPGRAASDVPQFEALRRDALAGRDVGEELANIQQSRFVAPGSAADNAIQRAADAAAMSTQPGWFARGVGGAGTLGLGGYGLLKTGDPWGALGYASLAGGAATRYLNPLARAINTADRNINVNQAFDAVYPAFRTPRPTTNVAPWADALRQLAIGAAQP